MSEIINDPLVVLEFPIPEGEQATRDDIVGALIARRTLVESVFTNDEYLKLDLTHQEIIGIKSTATVGKLQIGDLPALGHVVGNNERYKDSNLINLGNVSSIFKHILS